jgi:hypothetical protein
MKLFHLSFATIIGCIFFCSCGTNSQMAEGRKTTDFAGNPKGKGKFTEVKLTHPLDQQMVKNGKAVYDVKCTPCHKLTDEKLVGPGWKGVTDRRLPEWVMNFVTNTDEMIDNDPTVQALLEKCMVRMPNQHLTDDEARSVLEFMRNNDGKS